MGGWLVARQLVSNTRPPYSHVQSVRDTAAHALRWNCLMTRFALALLIVLSTGKCLGQDRPREFLSWYNGWGVHTVWGAGKVSGSYLKAHVKCGDTLIPVRAILDTHEGDGSPLRPNQTAAYVSSQNVALLRALEASGNTCTFQPSAEPSN